MTGPKRSLDELEARRSALQDDSIDGYLMRRTLGMEPVGCARQTARRQYINVCPTATLYDQEVSASLKRFSPCGQVATRPRSIRLMTSIWWDLGGAATRCSSTTSTTTARLRTP